MARKRRQKNPNLHFVFQSANAGAWVCKCGRLFTDDENIAMQHSSHPHAPPTGRLLARRDAAEGQHRVFREKKGNIVCICGGLFTDSQKEAEFHIENPHFTTEPEDWVPVEATEQER